MACPSCGPNPFPAVLGVRPARRDAGHRVRDAAKARAPGEALS